MEPLPGEDNFKHIPIRFYLGDNDNALSGGTVQRLIRPGLMVGDLAKEMGWEQPKMIVQGIQPDNQVPLEWMAKHLAYPDNFLHIAVFL